MRRHVAFAGLLLVAGAGVADTQARPDFTGAWTRVPDSATARPTVATTGDAAFRRGDMGSGWGSPLTMTQRTDSLILQYSFFSAYDLQPPVRLAYALDGSESRNAVMFGHAESVQRSRVSWAGSTLVINTRHPLPGFADGRDGAADVRHAMTLEGPKTLVVESTRLGVLGGPSTTTRTVYTRP